MTIDPDELLSEAALNAAVQSLAERNAHHLAEMTDEERENALGHWRQLATDVLIAARVTMEADSDVPSAEEHPGRAVVLFEDAGEEDVTVHTAFFPNLEELEGNEVRGTRAQIMALHLIGSLEVEVEEAEDDDDEDEK